MLKATFGPVFAVLLASSIQAQSSPMDSVFELLESNQGAFFVCEAFETKAQIVVSKVDGQEGRYQFTVSQNRQVLSFEAQNNSVKSSNSLFESPQLEFFVDMRNRHRFSQNSCWGTTGIVTKQINLNLPSDFMCVGKFR